MSGVHQFVPMLHRHDAVGGHTRVLRDLLVADGFDSRIYVEVVDPETAAETRPYLEYEAEAEPGDVLVYQLATYSAMARWLVARPEPLVVNYHSITPPSFFAPWSNGIARLQVDGLGDLALLAARADLGIAVSHFDEEELRAAGCAETVVIPVANAPGPRPAGPEGPARRAGGRAGASWLSVGRLAPNKCHHVTIAALFVARATSDPEARLTLVGSPSEPHYASALRRYAASLGLVGAVDFVSGIDDDELSERYRSADVLVMLSGHEGFGVPLVEAMANGLPVVARAAGAVPEVVGDAGVLLEDCGPRAVASAVAGVLADADGRSRMVERGRRRVLGMELDRAGERWVAAVSRFAPGRGAAVPGATVPGATVPGATVPALRPPGAATH